MTPTEKYVLIGAGVLVAIYFINQSAAGINNAETQIGDQVGGAAADVVTVVGIVGGVALVLAFL